MLMAALLLVAVLVAFRILDQIATEDPCRRRPSVTDADPSPDPVGHYRVRIGGPGPGSAEAAPS